MYINVRATKSFKIREAVRSKEISLFKRKKGLKKSGAFVKKLKEKNIAPTAWCEECKLPMNKKMHDTQIENKRPGGAKCMACIMGTKRFTPRCSVK